MSEFLAAVVGAIAGAIGTYYGDLRKRREERAQALADQQRERRRERSSIATALLFDIRTLEWVLRRLWEMPKPARWRGQSPAMFADPLREKLTLFTPETVHAVANFLGVVNDVYRIIGDLGGREEEERESDYSNWVIKCKVGFALQSLPAAVEALLGEGGMLPPADPVVELHEPALPLVQRHGFTRFDRLSGRPSRPPNTVCRGRGAVMNPGILRHPASPTPLKLCR